MLPWRRVAELDEADAFPRDVWSGLGELGALGLGIPDELGGSGGGAADSMVVCIELARRYPSLAVDYVLCGMVARMLVDHGTDVLLTTQYLDEADRLASHIVVIDHGKTIASGTPAQLKQAAGGSVIEVRVRGRDDLVHVAKVLSPFGTTDVQIDEPRRLVSLAVDGGIELLRPALQHLESMEVAIDDVALRQPKLDEVFLALTGQALDQEPEASPALA